MSDKPNYHTISFPDGGDCEIYLDEDGRLGLIMDGKDITAQLHAAWKAHKDVVLRRPAREQRQFYEQHAGKLCRIRVRWRADDGERYDHVRSGILSVHDTKEIGRHYGDFTVHVGHYGAYPRHITEFEVIGDE